MIHAFRQARLKRSRSTGSRIIDRLEWRDSGAAISTFLRPIGYSTIGAGPSMLVLCGLIIVGLCVAILWTQETKGLTLAEASALGQARVAARPA